jgi:ribosomal protein S18 acetylase RimI-like enzyme
MARPGHVKKMARRGDAVPSATPDHGRMHSRYVDRIVIRPLRSGDTATVKAMFARLGAGSRRQRFGGAKRELSEEELALLARVDGERHVLVAYVDDDPRPAGLARLVRQGSTAEVAFEVADECQGRGIGTALARMLAGDARAAGIVELHATVAGDNPRAISLLSRCARGLRGTWRGGERELVAALR